MRTTTEEKTKDIPKGAIATQAVAKTAAKKKSTLQTIQSRFGALEVDTAKAISFQHGILGVPGIIRFCVTDLPHPHTNQFKLLQCLEDESLCFIVVPSQYDNQLLENDDLDEACTILSVKAENLLVFFIVTVHDDKGIRRLSVNARAPILVDAMNKVGTQYVFQNPNYQIRHMIS